MNQCKFLQNVYNFDLNNWLKNVEHHKHFFQIHISNFVRRQGILSTYPIIITKIT